MNKKKLIDCAAGRIKADLVLKNGKLLNVFTGEITQTDVAVSDGRIAGLGHYEGQKEQDLNGAFILPGFIDSHLHIESSLLTPEQFSKVVVPCGTTTLIADPHEIANVKGLEGLSYMLESTEKLPLSVYFMLPSCVPATGMIKSGAMLDSAALSQLIGHKRVLGLGEVMDYPAVTSGDSEVIKKIELAENLGKNVDGHSPMLSGRDLNAYRAAGVTTDHECSTPEEMNERLSLGMYVLMREGSAARNLSSLLKGVSAENARRCLLCTDDKQSEDILTRGHINNNVRMAVAAGISPLDAVRMATLNAAECYGLKNKGAVAPGYDADIVIVKDLKDFAVEKVYQGGELRAENGKALFIVGQTDNYSVSHSVHISPLKEKDFMLYLNNDKALVIVLKHNDLVTGRIIRKVARDSEGFYKKSEDNNLTRLAVIERHKGTGEIGLGLIENLEITDGAMATTIAHDSHNLIVAGDNTRDMKLAAEELYRQGGGMTVCKKGEILGTLPLPIAGLMSPEEPETVNKKLHELNDYAWNNLGIDKNIDPFMTLAFMALPVIPDLKLTHKGLFDVNTFDLIDINSKGEINE